MLIISFYLRGIAPTDCFTPQIPALAGARLGLEIIDGNIIQVSLMADQGRYLSSYCCFPGLKAGVWSHSEEPLGTLIQDGGG